MFFSPMGWPTTLIFVMDAVCSAATGYFGMLMLVNQG